jgi:hypothetical protein
MRAKSADGTSREKEGRSYERAGHGDDLRFVCGDDVAGGFCLPA